MAVSIQVENLNRTYGSTPAVVDLSFTVPAGCFVTLLGPSGCGKTTTLRCLAGLDYPQSGSIWFGDRMVFGPRSSVSAKDRGVGMVFQSYAIWPHMRVYDNISYALKGRHVSAPEIRKQVIRVAEIVGIEKLLTRYPSQLSGGQQQRVALARSLVYEPSVLLLDEPLSNLDAKLRNQMRFELAELQQRLGTTTVYVTHNKGEALVMSDFILLMKDGRSVQFGTPEELYHKPKNRYAADFLGEANFLEGTIDETATDNRVVITTAGGVRLLAGSQGRHAAGTSVVAMVRLHHVLIAQKPQSSLNHLRAQVEYAAFAGEKRELRLKAEGLTVRGYSTTPFAVGDQVSVNIRPEDIIILESSSSRRSERQVSDVSSELIETDS